MGRYSKVLIGEFRILSSEFIAKLRSTEIVYRSRNSEFCTDKRQDLASLTGGPSGSNDPSLNAISVALRDVTFQVD